MSLVAFTGSEWIAVVGIAAGVLGTLGGYVYAHVSQRSEQEHARGLSRDERLHAQRLDAYVRIGEYLERSRMAVYRTEPFIGPQPDPPARLTDDEIARVASLAAIAGSAQIDAKIRSANERLRDFELAVLMWREREPGEFGETRRKLEDTRKAAFAAISDAEDAMRDELGE